MDMARNIDAVPVFAEEEELPACGIGNLDDETAVRGEETVGGLKIGEGFVEVFEDVEHAQDGDARIGERRLREGGAEGGDAILMPGDGSGVEREIHAENSVTFFVEESQEEAAAAADVHDERGAAGRWLRGGDGFFEKGDVVLEDKAAVEVFEDGDFTAFVGVPVIAGVIGREFGGGRCGIEADQFALGALDEEEGLGGSAVEAVGGFKESVRGGRAARDAGAVGSGDGGEIGDGVGLRRGGA